MSKTDTSTIRVRLRNQNHPSGTRRRAGFLFTTDVSEIEVTPEQLETIKSDEALYIMREHEEETQDPVIDTITNQDPVITGDQTGNPQGGGTDTDPKPENLKRANKGRLIEILIQELKQVPEKDFDPEATNDALIALIESIRATNGAAQ